MDLARSSLAEACGASRSGGARGEDVVDEEETCRRWPTGYAPKRIGHRLHPFFAGQAGLRSGRLRPADEGGRGQLQLACERPREHASLVEAALGPPPACERNPRHGVGRRRAERSKGGCERLPDPSPPGELQPMDRGLGRSPVRERRPRGGDRPGRTVPASLDVRRKGSPAARAPRRLEREELPGAGRAEGPRAPCAAGAGTWEENVDRSIEHGGTLRGAADTLRAGEPRSGRRRP
jgi:hypothetical protein